MAGRTPVASGPLNENARLGADSSSLTLVAASISHSRTESTGHVWLTIRLMKTPRQLTAIIEREDDACVALCPELDIASQGDTVESARKHLVEALELFFESADATEVARRLHGEVFVTRVEVMVG